MSRGPKGDKQPEDVIGAGIKAGECLRLNFYFRLLT